jgi:hypothetical protein
MRHLFFCSAILAATGCAGKPPVDNSQDPDAYARDVKQIVFTQVAAASKSREPADQVATIVAELQQTDRPRAKYEGTYDKLLTLARAIKADCEKAKGRPDNLAARLNELKATAQTLPGEVPKSAEDEPKAPIRD